MTSMDPISDSYLVQQSLSGDTRAFEEIVRRHLSAVSATAYALCGDSTASEDIAQETFLTAWQRLAQLENHEKLRAWLCAIARNIARALSRKKSNDPLSNADQLQDCQLGSHSHNSNEIAMKIEQQRLVWQAVSHIPEEYRLPLVLYYRENQSTREVAAALDLTEEAVRQRLSRARTMLKRDIAEFVNSSLQSGGPSPLLAAVIVGAIGTTVSHASAGAVLAGAAKAGTGLSAAGAAAVTSAIVGPLIGIAGGIYGNWISIKNAKSEAEKGILIKAAWQTVLLVLFWISALGTTIYLSVTGQISPKTSVLIGVANLAIYVVLLVYIILKANRAIAALNTPQASTEKPVRGNARLAAQANENPRQFMVNLLGSFGGGVFGSLAWVLSTAAMSLNWALFFTTVAFGAALMALVMHHTRKHPQRYWLNCTRAVGAIICYILLALWLFWSPALEAVLLRNNQWVEMSPTTQIVAAMIFYLVMAAASFFMHVKGERLSGVTNS